MMKLARIRWVRELRGRMGMGLGFDFGLTIFDFGLTILDFLC